MGRKTELYKPIRTTICLAPVLMKTARQMMRREGYDGNFSAYIAELIRRDLRRSERQKKRPVPKAPQEQLMQAPAPPPSVEI